MSEVRVPSVLVNSLAEGVSSVRVPSMFVAPLVGGFSSVRVPNMFVEPLVDGYSSVRLSLVGVQALFPVTEVPPVPTVAFPGFGNSASNPSIPAALDPFNSKLPGLSIEVRKVPLFNTKVHESSSLNETRTSYSEWPRWGFELSYEFLEDRTGAESSLKTIMGFFTDMQGSFMTWLFKDPDDYLVENGFMGEADAVTTRFYFRRYLGVRGEPVGVVDQANTIAVYRSIEEPRTVPSTPGPYTITVTNAAAFEQDLGVLGFTRVSGAPDEDQYSVNENTGVYTFNAANGGDVVTISYRYALDPSLYTVETNYIVFDSAPVDGSISADFQFFYVCRFLEDQMEFDKFADKLWSLQTCEFKSVLT